MPTLLLVDGSSYLYRAFHAMPDLRTTHDEPTGAIHGVLNMLRRLESDYQAAGIDYKGCVFDAKGRTFRDDWYPQYKANRPSMPDDLVRQIEPLHAAITALGWPLLMVDGVEADDVIGTLATQAAAQGVHVVVSTGDKDLAQLVGPHVRLVNTMSNEVFDEAGVLRKFGVPAAHIVDYLALIGDPVDNVPGVDKVGAKTAARWLAQYGSLDGVIAAAADIKGVVGDNLRRALGFLPLARRLVTVRCDLDLSLSPTDLKPRPADRARLIEIFTHYELRSWLKEVEGEAAASDGPTVAAPGPQPDPPSDGAHRAAYETILDWPTFERWLEKIERSPLTAFDTETTSLDPFAARLVGLSLAVAVGDAAYLPLAHHYPGAPAQLPFDDVLARLKPWLEADRYPKIGQHLKYDQHVLANHGLQLAGVAHDTLLQSYVLEAGKEGVRGHDLGTLAKRHLGLATIPYEALCGKGVNQIRFDQVAIDQAAEYAAEDADLCLRLHARLYPQIAADAGLLQVYETIEMPVREILFRMERHGVRIDSQLLAQQSHEIGKRLLDLEARAYLAAGQPFNVNSPKQLAEILFDRLGLPVKKKTPSGTPSTDEEVLSELALDYPLPKILLESRQLSKLKGTYTDKLPKMVNAATGRVHTSYAQAIAVTGRLSSSDPNLQNIPVRTAEGRRIRAGIHRAGGLAHRVGRLFADRTADHGAPVRRRAPAAKPSPPARTSIVRRLRKCSASRWRRSRGSAAQLQGDQFRADLRHVRLSVWRSSCRCRAPRRKRISISISSGIPVCACSWTKPARRRPRGICRNPVRTPPVSARYQRAQPQLRQAAERTAINAPMQGTGADIVKRAMLAVDSWLRRTTSMRA
jgi:DNA polymerase-1